MLYFCLFNPDLMSSFVSDSNPLALLFLTALEGFLNSAKVLIDLAAGVAEAFNPF